MAAPTALTLERTANERTDCFLNTTGQDGESLSAGSGDVRDYVVDFLEKEVGSDLKSLKNVGDLLEKLREENAVLEEQVNSELRKTQQI